MGQGVGSSAELAQAFGSEGAEGASSPSSQGCGASRVAGEGHPFL